MKDTNWIRILMCGFVAGVIWNLLDTAFLVYFAPDLVAPVQRNAPHPPLGGLFFLGVDLAMGVWAVWLYSAIAPRYGTRPTTAVIAGIAWWLLKTLQSAKWAGLGFVALGANVVPVGAATLVAATLATMTGAWLYQKVSVAALPDVPATTP